MSLFPANGPQDPTGFDTRTSDWRLRLGDRLAALPVLPWGLGLNALLVLALCGVATEAGLPSPWRIGAAVAAPLLGLAGVFACRHVHRRGFAPGAAAALLGLLLLQWAVAGRQWPLLLLNAAPALLLLQSLRRPLLLLCAAIVLLPAPWWLAAGFELGPWMAPGLAGREEALLWAAGIGILSLLGAQAALQSAQVARERFDIQFLVRAMGQSGPIRLGLEAVKAESDLGHRLKQVQQRMAVTLRQVQAAAAGVREAAGELDQGGRELSDRTERAAAGLRDAAMTLEQINLIVQSSAEATLKARSMALEASEEARQGGALFAQLTAGMRDIDGASRSISDITTVIEGIAFQTNLLALNAAVEAARAGSAGRGFAVVAAEVRQLALRASGAAGQIKGLVERSNAAVRGGSELVHQAGHTMQRIVRSSGMVGQAFEHLSADTSEHAGSIDAVTTAVRELDEITRQNVTVAETTRRVAQALLDQGGQLDQVLGSFKLGDGLAAASFAAPAAQAPTTAAPSTRSSAAPAPAPAQPATAGMAPSATSSASANSNVEFF